MAGPNWCERCSAYRPRIHQCDTPANAPDQVSVLQARVDILEQLTSEHAGEIYLAQASAYRDGYRDGFADGRAG